MNPRTTKKRNSVVLNQKTENGYFANFGGNFKILTFVALNWSFLNSWNDFWNSDDWSGAVWATESVLTNTLVHANTKSTEAARRFAESSDDTLRHGSENCYKFNGKAVSSNGKL